MVVSFRLCLLKDIEAELNTVIEEVLEAAVKEVADVAASFTSAALA